MGKTPEKASSHAGAMRYRRKAPTTAPPPPPTANESVDDDNQTEHHQHGTQDERSGSKSAYVRKKKPKGSTDHPPQDMDVKKMKKKVLKRQLSADPKNNQSEEQHTSTQPNGTASQDAVVAVRKRKPHKKPHASLLNQLLWKAKRPEVPVVLETAVTSVPRHLKHDDEDEEEERAYAHDERLHLKAHAASSSSSKQSDHLGRGRVESSSQETQSGSDDEDVAGFLPFENLVPLESTTTTTSLVMDAVFPTPFPLVALTSCGFKTHTILLEDFVFEPQQLRIQCGDVVVWTVSQGTLAMVEHCLEVTWRSTSATTERRVVTATTPLLGGGSAFAWRFVESGRVSVVCSVYQTRGIILVGDVKLSKREKKKKATTTTTVSAPVQAEPPLESVETKSFVTTRAARKTKSKRGKERTVSVELESSNNTTLDDEETNVTVFHPPASLAQSVEVDAGVCRAVLCHLEEVAAANAAIEQHESETIVAPVIVIGDVECPVGDMEDESDVLANKHSQQADEWSGTEEEEEEEDEQQQLTSREDAVDEMEDFQQKIIGMLRRSEETRVRHRQSFEADASGFDAGAAYDFFKQRFSQIKQDEREIVYSVCPEPQRGSGVDLLDVVSLLSA